MDLAAAPSPTSDTPVRATDDDRTRAATRLDDAYARGALEPDEHERRVAAAWEAGDCRELTALTADLPGPSPAELERVRRDTDLALWLGEWRWWLGGAIVMSTVWGAQAIRSGPDFFWPLVPLAIWAAVLVAAAVWPSESDD